MLTRFAAFTLIGALTLCTVTLPASAGTAETADEAVRHTAAEVDAATDAAPEMLLTASKALAISRSAGDVVASDARSIQARTLTPAERAIRHARTALELGAEPKRYSALAMALARRARETADSALYDEAETTVAKALEMAPESLEALRTKAWILLGKHQFAAAREIAEEINARYPDDILTYGLIADAAVELGDYAAAEEAVQWMLDLRPGNVPGLTRGAYLRELFGDLAGALEWMGDAYHRVRPTETEDRAWILTQMAHLERNRGELDSADRLAERALAEFPGYHYTVAEQARIRESQGRLEEAVELWRRHYESAAHPENLFYLARAVHRTGRVDEAMEQMAKFERLALEESESEDNANRDLALYYIDYADRPADGLALAERELKRRRDVLTLDTFAWALYANGRHAEARAALAEALAVGTRHPQILAHASVIPPSPEPDPAR